MTVLPKIGFSRSRGESGHYDPNQPRVPSGDPSHHGGRWTKDGVTSASVAVEIDPRVVRRLGALLPRALAEALARIAALASLPLVALGALLLPRTGNRFAEGNVPGHPDIGYSYENGVLTLTLGRDADGQMPLLYQGRADADRFYRLADGTAVAHDLGTGIVLNERAIGAERRRQAARARARARAEDEVKLCPDPGPDRPNNDNIDWKLYQMQISGLPLGKAVVLNGVYFDGCRTSDGTMLEAKGERYAQFIKKDGSDWYYWYESREDTIRQMRSQSMAAKGRMVEWHVAEKKAADFFEQLAAMNGFTNIKVVHTPPAYKPTVDR